MSGDSPTQNNSSRERRPSVTHTALANLFQQRPNPTANGTPAFPSANMNTNTDAQRRRLSLSTMGLVGTSPTSTSTFSATSASSLFRRGSMSTNSDSIDENAVEEDDFPSNTSKTAPTTPFTRRMSFGAQAMRNLRTGSGGGGGGGGSPGSNGNQPSAPNGSPSAQPAMPGMLRRSSMHATARGPSSTSPGSHSAAFGASSNSATGRRGTSSILPTVPQAQASNAQSARPPSDVYSSRPDQQGFNWSEQLRSRAESSVQGQRPSFSFGSGMSSSPPRNGAKVHDRAKSVSDMPAPPAQAAAMKPKQPERPKPDHFQERILKGDFYMD